MIERVKAPQTGPEKEMLCAFLDYGRATILWKIAGLSDEDLRRVIVPSGWSLLGLVKHLSMVESWWFETQMAGGDVRFPYVDSDPNSDFRIEPHETTDEIVSRFEQMVEISRGITTGADLDDETKGRERPGRSLRWVLLHLIEEYSRHNGHADVVRELIDGSVGD